MTAVSHAKPFRFVLDVFCLVAAPIGAMLDRVVTLLPDPKPIKRDSR